MGGWGDGAVKGWLWAPQEFKRESDSGRACQVDCADEYLRMVGEGGIMLSMEVGQGLGGGAGWEVGFEAEL